MAEAVSGDGVWVHALDADEPLDASLAGSRSWDEQLGELDKTLAFAARHYPWLRYVSMGALWRELEWLDGLAARFELRSPRDGVTSFVVESSPGVTVRLRHPGLRVQNVEGGSTVYSYARADATVLRAAAGRMTVTLSRKR